MLVVRNSFRCVLAACLGSALAVAGTVPGVVIDHVLQSAGMQPSQGDDHDGPAASVPANSESYANSLTSCSFNPWPKFRRLPGSVTNLHRTFPHVLAILSLVPEWAPFRPWEALARSRSCERSSCWLRAGTPGDCGFRIEGGRRGNRARSLSHLARSSTAGRVARFSDCRRGGISPCWRSCRRGCR